MTPLMYATKDNKTSIMDRMIELGADVGARNNVSTIAWLLQNVIYPFKRWKRKHLKDMKGMP